MKVCIVSIGAKNIHKMLAPWCLKSYCEDKGIKGIDIIEVNINDNINEIISKIYKSGPDVAAFSCYIWNIDYVNKIGVLIKKLLPDIKIILGGPEVSFEEDLRNYPFADCVISGAGEKTFFDLLQAINQNKPFEKIIDGCSQDFNNYPTPYTSDYFDSFQKNQIPFIENQLVYYESSRGCPFFCSYCLSSTFKGIQYLSLDRVKSDLLRFIEKGAKCIKFVDRTFNSDKKRAKQILEFIYSLNTDCAFHFEAAADLFDDALFEIIEKMPLGRIQFEIGIQTTNEKTLEAIDRKTDISLVLKNIGKLASFQNCHVHVDLIAGLPHEDISTFSQAINQCIRCKPHMLQLGFLKMLKGTKIRSANYFGAIFADFPPYEVYQTDTLKYDDVIILKKIENIIERFYNSGAFESSINYAIEKIFETPYKFFKEFSDYCNAVGYNFKVSMKNAYTVLFNFLLLHGDRKEAEHCIKLDCLALDDRLLPDEIIPQRNKRAESAHRGILNKSAKIRIEYFEFDNTHKLFVYENKNIITGKFEVRNFEIGELAEKKK